VDTEENGRKHFAGLLLPFDSAGPTRAMMSDRRWHGLARPNRGRAEFWK
jgi:hypothetical protein